MKDYPDRYTNEMINVVEAVKNNNIRDISVTTAMTLNKIHDSIRYSN